MSISPNKKEEANSNRKVVIFLQDHDAIGKIFVEIQGELSGREAMVEAFNRLKNGFIYADEGCTELVDEEYIEIFPKKRGIRRSSDFVFLIDRDIAEDYIIAVKIMK